jgi:formate dehydrogenase subunit gamma
MTGLFGGVDNSRVIHHWAGVLFIATTLIIFLQWMKDITAPGDDTLGEVIKSYIDPSFKAPPSGKFNAGQKFAGWVALILGVIMAGTGLAMWFPFKLGQGIQQWMYFLHNLGFILFMGFLLIHAYLGTIGVPGTWRAMTNHAKWDAEEA